MSIPSCAPRPERRLLARAWACSLLLACSAEPPAEESGGGAGAGGATNIPAAGGGGWAGTGGGGWAGTGGGGAAAAGSAGARPGGGHSGSGGSAASAAGGSGDGRDDFGTVREMVGLVCGDSSCHGGEHALFLRDDPKLYSTLTTYVSAGCDGRLLVQPGAPDASALALVLQGACGTVPRMPNGCVEGQTCIPTDYVQGVRRWIASGAPP